MATDLRSAATRPGPMAQARRVLERHWSARIVVALVVAIPALAAVERGHVALGVAGLVAAVGFVAVVGMGAPAVRLARLERRASAGVPEGDRAVTVAGTVVAATAPLTAPHSGAACVAYWERTLAETEEGWATFDESAASVDFVLRCGDTLVAVDAAEARVLFDPGRASRTRDEQTRQITEEQAARIGDRVLVSGHLVHGPGGGPHRTAARIGRRDGEPITIGLVGAATRDAAR